MVDRIVLTVHWGVPYDPCPSEEDRDKAHFAIDCGADIIIGHHPHIIQDFEIYKNRAIFYSIGNFAFGSGNSKAESIVLGINFKKLNTEFTLFPAYIKNRNPRISYQPKILCGDSSKRYIERLKAKSGLSGESIIIQNDTGKIIIPLK